MVSIPWRSRDTPIIDYFKFIIMTSDEYIATLEDRQERWRVVAWEKR